MTLEVFRQKAPWIMQLLMEDFDLGLFDAAAIAGNLGHESGGLTAFQEVNPTVPGSLGGWGWGQWTGHRRRGFDAYYKRNNLDPKSDQANYGWLFSELKGTDPNYNESRSIPAVKAKTTLGDKVVAFENSYERAGVKHYDSRKIWATRALEAYQAAPKPIELPQWARPVVKPDEPPVIDERPGFWHELIVLITKYWIKGE